MATDTRVTVTQSDPYHRCAGRCTHQLGRGVGYLELVSSDGPHPNDWYPNPLLEPLRRNVDGLDQVYKGGQQMSQRVSELYHKGTPSINQRAKLRREEIDRINDHLDTEVTIISQVWKPRYRGNVKTGDYKLITIYEYDEGDEPT